MNTTSKRPCIALRTQNGLSYGRFVADVLDINKVTSKYWVREAGIGEIPDVVVFGPYGAEIPPPGPYVRVGYICENYKYDGPPCEFIFTISRCSVPNAVSARIQWHGVDPQSLVKPADYDVKRLIAEKTHFCNFLYSNLVSYREDFFRRLSKYRRVDSPGASMNNMESIDVGAPLDQSRWETKRRFLARYKFTLAIENEIFPGYQTEKLYDAMRANSIPIIWVIPRCLGCSILTASYPRAPAMPVIGCVSSRRTPNHAGRNVRDRGAGRLTPVLRGVCASSHGTLATNGLWVSLWTASSTKSSIWTGILTCMRASSVSLGLTAMPWTSGATRQ